MQCPHLERIFPKLSAAGYEKTSDATGEPPNPGAYNCIAWAANDTHHGYWWPNEDSYWPSWIERKPTIPCFVLTFRWLGYRICANSRREFAYEKVVLYAREGTPTHMARQLRDGAWTSKCGPLEDITHFTLDALESDGPPLLYAEYGRPALHMKRLIIISWVVRLIQWTEWKTYSSWRWS
jgi:hypothetical protein